MQELNEYGELCVNLLNEHDDYWMHRKRKLNTLIIFQHLVNSSIKNIGVSTDLSISGTCSHTAMINARMKIQPDIFKTINSEIQKHSCEHIYAIDGSKLRVHEEFKKFGYKSRTCDRLNGHLQCYPHYLV